MKPILSLVTGTLSRPESFRRLVESIRLHTKVSWELVVSDASDPSYAEEVENLVILPERPRLGHSAGYNKAFAAASGEFVIWLNDDCTVVPDYDTEAIAFMEAHPAVGLGCLHYSENSGPFHWNSAWNVGYGNFAIIRKEIGDKVGWFDTDLQMYGSDNSLAIKLLLADYGVADIPKARILHHSVNDQVRRDNQQYKLRDNRILTEKYMPSHRVWAATFRKHYVPSGHAPWSHGVAPELVRA